MSATRLQSTNFVFLQFFYFTVNSCSWIIWKTDINRNLNGLIRGRTRKERWKDLVIPIGSILVPLNPDIFKYRSWINSNWVIYLLGYLSIWEIGETITHKLCYYYSLSSLHTSNFSICPSPILLIITFDLQFAAFSINRTHSTPPIVVAIVIAVTAITRKTDMIDCPNIRGLLWGNKKRRRLEKSPASTQKIKKPKKEAEVQQIMAQKIRSERSHDLLKTPSKMK